MNARKNTVLGILAGIMIGIGGSVYLACDIKYIGAVLFAVALLVICIRGYALFTGKVGFLAYDYKGKDIGAVACCLFGNAIGTFVSGIAVRYALPALGATAETICAAKLTQTPGETVVRAIFCGILMYIAVVIYRENKTTAGIFFCVPVFILSGFEHSIANMFYFSAAASFTWETLLYLGIVLLGNTAGGLLMPMLKKAAGKD